jgi:hypothetical protein
MKWNDIPAKVRDQLLKRRDAGELIENLAAEVDMRPSTLGRRLRGYNAHKNGTETMIKRPATKRRKWDDPPVFRGDAAVTGDLQLPYLDYDFAERMLVTSSIMLPKPRRLIIAGDLFNMDAYSPFPPAHTLRATWQEEIASARNFLVSAKEVFDEVDVLIGNHERRLLYLSRGELSSQDLGLLVDVKGVNFYIYSWCVLDTLTGEWRITHQHNYSINAQTVGVKLAHKFRQHVITHHQHRVSKGHDSSGKSVVIDNGCLADPAMLDFTTIVDNTRPVMTQGFVVVRDGAGSLFTNDLAFTDWGLFLE